MSTRKKLMKRDEESISLLTTLLVRYPELCTVNYAPKGNVLKLSFIVREEWERKQIQEFADELSTCINTYLHFSGGIEPNMVRINRTYGPGITVLEITRDTNTLSQKEIAMIMDYIRENFSQKILCEELYINEDDLLEQDYSIGSLLDKLRENNPQKRLIAVREEGKVLVFQR